MPALQGKDNLFSSPVFPYQKLIVAISSVLSNASSFIKTIVYTKNEHFETKTNLKMHFRSTGS